MDTNTGKVPGFFLFASPFSFLYCIFCSSKPECPKKRGLPPCSECPVPLEGCPPLGLLNRSAEPQEGTSISRKTLPEALKSSKSPQKRPRRVVLPPRNVQWASQIRAPHDDFSQQLPWGREEPQGSTIPRPPSAPVFRQGWSQAALCKHLPLLLQF